MLRDSVVNQQDCALRMTIVDGQGRDSRTYNCPTADEVGALIIGLGEENHDPRDIIIRAKASNSQESHLQRINELHASYLPLRFVLLLP